MKFRKRAHKCDCENFGCLICMRRSYSRQTCGKRRVLKGGIRTPCKCCEMHCLTCMHRVIQRDYLDRKAAEKKANSHLPKKPKLQFDWDRTTPSSSGV